MGIMILSHDSPMTGGESLRYSSAQGEQRYKWGYEAMEPVAVCNVVFTCQDSVSALFLRTGELRDDAAHDMRIRTRQCFADPEQEIHLRWSQLHVAWLVPVG